MALPSFWFAISNVRPHVPLLRARLSSFRTPRPRELAGASFFLELQDAIERVWEEWTPTADVRGMMHFGDRSQPLSVLPGQRANSARPDPRRECPSGTAA